MSADVKRTGATAPCNVDVAASGEQLARQMGLTRPVCDDSHTHKSDVSEAERHEAPRRVPRNALVGLSRRPRFENRCSGDHLLCNLILIAAWREAEA